MEEIEGWEKGEKEERKALGNRRSGELWLSKWRVMIFAAEQVFLIWLRHAVGNVHTFQENTETCKKEKVWSGGKQTDTVKNYVWKKLLHWWYWEYFALSSIVFIRNKLSIILHIWQEDWGVSVVYFLLPPPIQWLFKFEWLISNTIWDLTRSGQYKSAFSVEGNGAFWKWWIMISLLPQKKRKCIFHKKMACMFLSVHWGKNSFTSSHSSPLSYSEDKLVTGSARFHFRHLANTCNIHDLYIPLLF